MSVDPLENTAPAADHTVTAAGLRVAAAPDDALIGRQLGHFKIDKKLGAGGMGEVYLATDLALDRPVAVKVLPEHTARDPKRRERLIREARAQARVAHHNVGHMYFVGEDDNRLYFAMEYVNGETLADRVAKGPMPVDEALAVVRAVALGLREAHKAGITHRDIKPSNLMIDPHGVVKVLDFGLAAGNLEAATAGPVAQTSLAGTPLYMAPEQARGDAVDFRTDIYALGATLFHLVSGKPPFEADSVEGLVSLHATAARPALPRRGQRLTQIGAIDALCRKMMSASPGDRFASYDELLRAIELTSDAHTRPAGFWARSIAMLIDIVIVMFTFVIAIQLMLYLTDREFSGPISLPALLLVQAFAIARWGTTPGKSLMELEVVDVRTLERPTLGRSFRRALVLFGIPIAVQVAAMFTTTPRPSPEAQGEPNFTIGGSGMAGLIVLLYALVGLAWLAYASLRASGKRALWDRAAGTLVRYRTTRRSLPGS